MKISKLAIVKYFLLLRFSRIFSSDKVSLSRKKKWRKILYKSKYYRDILSKNKELPLMNKVLFMSNFNDINTVGIKKQEALEIALESEKSRDFTPSINGISIGLSSGTSGNVGIFLTSKKEKEIWVAAILDRVIGFSLKKRKVAFFLRANNNLYEAVRSNILSFDFFDIKTKLEEHIDRLYKLEADILVAQPSILVAIARKYQKQGIKPTFTKVISVAEVLEDDQKKYLETVFNCRISQVYQCTEGFLAYTCKYGELHLNEDWIEIEKKYLDREKERFHPVITDYLRESQPVVRYELNDILHERGDFRCRCGAKSTVIAKIEGRSDDVFQFYKDDLEINIYPDFIRRAVIVASDKILNYMVTLVDKNTVDVYLEVEGDDEFTDIFERVKEELIAMFASFGVDGISITKTKHLNYERTSKFRRIKNEYSKSFQN